MCLGLRSDQLPGPLGMALLILFASILKNLTHSMLTSCWGFMVLLFVKLISRWLDHMTVLASRWHLLLGLHVIIKLVTINPDLI